MTHEDAFIAAIIANPADDAVRLIYADWIDGQGREEMGEFIRVQVELAGLRCEDGRILNETGGSGACRGCARWRELRSREHELWPKALFSILDEVRGMRLIPDTMIVYKDDERLDHMTNKPEAYVSRGFISEVRLSCQDWMQHGPALVRRHPIERVVLVDRKPYYNAAGAWIWVMTEGLGHPESAALPKPLYKSLYGFSDVISYIRGYGAAYHTESSALAALSAAALLYARQTEPAAVRV